MTAFPSPLPWRRHPAFAPYAQWLADADGERPPAVARIDELARKANRALPDGGTLRFEPSEKRRCAALAYETSIARRGVVPLRDGDWHDAFNALAWLAMPRAKAALNALHVREALAPTPNRRSAARDAATLLDESGLVLACDDARVRELLAAHEWRRLFVGDRNALIDRTRVAVLGHALLDRLRRPFRALTARALVIVCEPADLPGRGDVAALDCLAACAIDATAFRPAALLPLPVAALPGWDCERLGAALFDDASVFRPKVLRSPA